MDLVDKLNNGITYFQCPYCKKGFPSFYWNTYARTVFNKPSLSIRIEERHESGIHPCPSCNSFNVMGSGELFVIREDKMAISIGISLGG